MRQLIYIYLHDIYMLSYTLWFMVPCYAHDVRVPPPGFFVNNQYRILLDQQGAGSRDFSLGEA